MVRHPSSYRNVALRIGVSVCCFVCALVVPWWIAMYIVAGVIIYTRFYELIFVGFVLGALYGGEVGMSWYVLALAGVSGISYGVRRVLWHAG